MNSRKGEKLPTSPAKLREMLEQAIQAGKDAVEFEREGNGWLITYMEGGCGVGTIVGEEQAQPVIEFLAQALRRAKAARSGFEAEILGESRRITVEKYETFGEWAYRLRWRSAGKKAT